MAKLNKILLVEDEKTVQVYLKEVLTSYCDELYIANDGQDGLELFKKHLPELIISDIGMPNMSGIEMCKAIKTSDIEQPSIIFSTAFTDIEYFQEAIELQVDGYLLKPIKFKLLEKKINSIIANIEIKKELKRKELLLVQQSKLASLGDMMNNIAHQWKQPLSTILMNINTIQVDIELGNIDIDTLKDFTEDTTHDIQRLAKTIDKFRKFFNTSDDIQDIFSVKESIDIAYQLIKSGLKNKEIEWIDSIDASLTSFGNSSQLSQALLNILNNSKEVLEKKDLDKKLIIIDTKYDDENIIITIKDNGGGIDADIIDRMFEPYSSTKHPSDGIGLGLYMSYIIITNNFKGSIYAMNSNFKFQDKIYSGAKFIVTLPKS